MSPPPAVPRPLAGFRLGRSVPVALLLVAVAAGLAWRFLPLRAAGLVAAVVATVGLLVAWVVGRGLAGAYRAEASSYDAVAAVASQGAAGRARELAQIERVVASAMTTSLDAHLRLRPLLRAIVVPQLAEEEAADQPTREAGAAAVDAALARRGEELGPALWELVRPGRPRPEESGAPGLGLAELRAVVEKLEAMVDDAQPA